MCRFFLRLTHDESGCEVLEGFETRYYIWSGLQMARENESNGASGSRVLRRDSEHFAQLPPNAVLDGNIMNPAQVRGSP